MREHERFGSLLGASIAVATVALIGAAGSAALAQTAGTAGPVSLGDLFKPPDSMDFRDGAEGKLGDAAGQVVNPRGCPQQAKFKVIVVAPLGSLSRPIILNCLEPTLAEC